MIAIDRGTRIVGNGAKRKRVLLLVDNPYLGGVTSHVLSILTAMAGHEEFEFLTACFPGWRADTTLLESAERLGLKVHVFPMRFRFDPRVAGAVRRFIIAQGVDLVHTHGYRSTLISALACNIPMISTCHGQLVEPDLRTRLWQWASLIAMRRHRAVIACSKHVRRWLIAEGTPAEKVRIIPNCCPPPKIGGPEQPGSVPAERTYRCPPPKITGPEIHINPDLQILYIGRLAPGKGVDVLLDALAGMTGVKVVIVGDGPLRATLENQANRLRIPVEFAGGTLDPDPYYRRADLVTLPSRMEAMPMALIEAAAHGKPALASRVGGIPEVVQDNQTGILVDPGDVNSLREAIARLMDPALRDSMGRAARELWEEKFSPNVMAKALEKLYETVLQT